MTRMLKFATPDRTTYEWKIGWTLTMLLTQSIQINLALAEYVLLKLQNLLVVSKNVEHLKSWTETFVIVPDKYYAIVVLYVMFNCLGIFYVKCVFSDIRAASMLTNVKPRQVDEHVDFKISIPRWMNVTDSCRHINIRCSNRSRLSFFI